MTREVKRRRENKHTNSPNQQRHLHHEVSLLRKHKAGSIRLCVLPDGLGHGHAFPPCLQTAAPCRKHPGGREPRQRPRHDTRGDWHGLCGFITNHSVCPTQPSCAGLPPPRTHVPRPLGWEEETEGRGSMTIRRARARGPLRPCPRSNTQVNYLVLVPAVAEARRNHRAFLHTPPGPACHPGKQVVICNVITSTVKRKSERKTGRRRCHQAPGSHSRRAGAGETLRRAGLQ